MRPFCTFTRSRLVVSTEEGPVGIWFKPETANKPENYDYSVPLKGRPGWRVYFLFLGIIACIVAFGLCAWLAW
jgi:hypothetical protein